MLLRLFWRSRGWRREDDGSADVRQKKEDLRKNSHLTKPKRVNCLFRGVN